MFKIKKENIKKYIIFSIIGFVCSFSLYIWNYNLITGSLIDLKKLLSMAITYDPKIAYSFFEYLYSNGLQWKESSTLIINIFFLICYSFLYINYYSMISLNTKVPKLFSFIAPNALKIGLILASADFIKTVILILMVYFYKLMPTWIVYIHSTLTFIVMTLYNIMLLWFFINFIVLGISYLIKRKKI
ncbi:MAG: hypothetical protein A2Y34_15875 [Spirochaetes bacterium GWC1_27_15]|nr:MAG: hypothetical protein A2Z98_18535 [Spirochaetes bacterium GWB1_27_13]OHD27300.1 MAG: hypothetical protein A2Y34_15875 [Spirochaetes bacterium GWC1_27_15]